MFDWIEPLLTGNASYVTLFVSALTSATILPGSSEALLVAMLLNSSTHEPMHVCGLVAVATLGNTLGGMVSWMMGYYFPHKLQDTRGIRWCQRYGVWCLLLGWAPIVGDAIMIAAGWLRFPGWLTFRLSLLGRTARYAMVAYLTLMSVSLVHG